MKKITAAVAFLAIAINSFAQDVDKLIKQDDVERIIKTLSADDMRGSATFTPDIERAAQFIEKEYKQAGLVPLAGNKDYRQNFTMTRSTPVTIAVTINGKPISPDSVLVSTTAPALNWANGSSDVQVVTLTGDKTFRTESAGYLKSSKKLLVLTDPKFAANITNSKARSKNGVMSYKANDDQAIVYVIGKFDNVKSFTVNYAAKVDKLPLFNIAGMIPGKSKPDEYVVFSGHYDHLGVVTGNRVMEGDSIANGADDDASGTTAVITLAKYFKKLNNNERTLIFVAFCAEEIGEYGSKHFAETVNPDKVTAMFNIEMIGKPSKFGTNSAFITGYERSDFGPILQKNLEGTTFKFYPDPYPEQNLFYRSDNASLAEVGVPAHTISTDQIPTDKLYHTVKDEFSSLDVSNITSTIRAIALSSRGIVSGKDTPTRVPKLER
ncbi:MAG TPA: M20/M25/M40 family metallo-hydrolase [Mucilaginibacter sp.]